MKKPKQTTDEPLFAWVVREPMDWCGDYFIFMSEPKKHPILTGWITKGSTFHFSRADFHKHFPNIRLKPGEGPIKVRLRAEIVE